MGTLEEFSACVPKVPLEKHKALRGLGEVVGRSSREEEAFKMRLDTFQLRATARLNCVRYFFDAHWVSGVVPGGEDTSTKETDPSSMSIARNNKNRNNNTEKRFGIMIVGAGPGHSPCTNSSSGAAPCMA